MLLTKKERKKERNRPKTIPSPPAGGGVNILREKGERSQLIVVHVTKSQTSVHSKRDRVNIRLSFQRH